MSVVHADAFARAELGVVADERGVRKEDRNDRSCRQCLETHVISNPDKRIGYYRIFSNLIRTRI